MMSQVIAFVFLCIVLAIAAVTDVRRGKVYNWLTYPAMGLGLVYWGVVGSAIDGWGGGGAALGQSATGLAAGLIPFALIRYAGGLGGGDVKLMGAVGAISASWACVLSTAVYALVLAAVMAVAVMIARGLVRRTLGRILGAALQWGARMTAEFPADSPRIAFGLAIAVGGIVAASEQLLGLNTPWAWLNP
jgi:prepilin peptidase CpaA